MTTDIMQLWAEIAAGEGGGIVTPVTPVVMRVETAARYCDMSVSTFRKLKIPAVTANERGERMWRRVDIDEYWESRRNTPANGLAPVE